MPRTEKKTLGIGAECGCLARFLHPRAAVNTKNLEIEETYVKFYNAVRSYNSLFYFGKIARSLGIKMKNYNGELPENQPDFDPLFTQEVMEDGTIIHKSKYKKRKK